MPIMNVEIKARCTNQDRIRNILMSKGAAFRGIDHQIDTYFNTVHGRLKLREGTIENYLIFYKRDNVAGPKQSEILLYKTIPGASLKEILRSALGVLIVVDKTREIYFIDNVKFHIDSVVDLGTFVEIEAIDTDGAIGIEELTRQCNFYRALFDIKDQDLITSSYSDLLHH